MRHMLGYKCAYLHFRKSLVTPCFFRPRSALPGDVVGAVSRTFILLKNTTPRMSSEHSRTRWYLRVENGFSLLSPMQYLRSKRGRNNRFCGRYTLAYSLASPP